MGDDDPFGSRAPKPAAIALDTMSVDELHARIAQLKDEIRACEAAVSHKEAQRAKADALFRGDLS
jgi:uncharacterized small protein (DUF1192 family)